MKTQYDQYGAEIPSDLVVLDTPSSLSLPDEVMSKLLSVNWYVEAERVGRILVSGKAVDWATETSPLDAGGPIRYPLLRVDTPLKRYNTQDGFYHA